MVVGVHYKQKYDRDEMHKGVLRDIERLQVKRGAQREAAAAAAAAAGIGTG